MSAMYQGHFGLAEAPFSIAPDPRYLYMSQRHQEALAHLLYGLDGDGGFVLLTGEVGTGKTTLCRCLLEQVPPTCDVAYIFNPKLTVGELLSSLCVEFGIACPAGNTSVKVYIDCINRHLLEAHARGRSSVLIIDEAQNLSVAVLEQMRLLTNLETSQRKLLQIILIGQPELAVMLAQPELRQLAQRIVARYHLGALSRPELAEYVGHRLDVAGGRRQLFPAALMGRLYRLSGGVPRIVNVLCDRALLGTYVQGGERVSRATLAKAAQEVLPRPAPPRPLLVHALLLVLFVSGALALAGAAYHYDVPVGLFQPAHQAAPLAAPAAPGAVAAVPVAAVPVASVPPLPDVLQWPEQFPRGEAGDIAFATLLQSWGIAGQWPNPCRQAESLGLRCRIGRGGLAELRQANRPAILRMKDGAGGEFDATLTGLDDKSAHFRIGSESRTVALAALATQWSGDYTLLWRVPPQVRQSLRVGERGPTADWLALQLARLAHKDAAPPRDAVFDDALQQRLKQFQLAEGLAPDGKLGPQTLLRLGTAADVAAPRLLGAAAAG